MPDTRSSSKLKIPERFKPKIIMGISLNDGQPHEEMIFQDPNTGEVWYPNVGHCDFFELYMENQEL